MKRFLTTFSAVIAAIIVCVFIGGIGYLSIVDRRVETQGNRAVEIARIVWGRQACNGAFTIKEASLPGNQSGEANWTETKLPTGIVRSNCVITVDRRRWSSDQYCGVIVHEYGHLLGKKHTNNPYTIMYPVMTDKNIPGRCQRSVASSDG